jgi:hypothetical protein
MADFGFAISPEKLPEDFGPPVQSSTVPSRKELYSSDV